MKITVNLNTLTSDDTAREIVDVLNKIEGVKAWTISTGILKRELIVVFETKATPDELVALGCLIGTLEGTAFNK